MTRIKPLYIINKGNTGRLGVTRSMEQAKKLILKKGGLLTKHDIIRRMPSGTETRIGEYQIKLRGYRFGNRLALKKVR